MSWAEEDWTVGLSGRVLQKVKELQVHHERLSRENKQKQLQIDNIQAGLEKQTVKFEEVRGELHSVQRELQGVRDEAKAAVTSRERLSQELQTKQAQLCCLEGQLDAARTLSNKLTEEVKRLEVELEKLQNSNRSADTTPFSTPCWNTTSPWDNNGSKKEERSGQRDEGTNRGFTSRQRLHFYDAAPSPFSQSHKSTTQRHPSDQSDGSSTPSAVFPWGRDDSRPAPRRQSPSSPQATGADVTNRQQAQLGPGGCGKESDYRRDADRLQTRVSSLEEELSAKAAAMKSIQNELAQSRKDLAAKELSVQRVRDELSRAQTRMALEGERALGAEQKLKQLQEELKCERKNAESCRLQHQQRAKDLEKQHQRDLTDLQKERQCLEKQHQQEINKLNHELQQARTLHNTLQAQIDKLSLQKQALDKELDTHKEKLKWTEGQLKESQKKETQTQAQLTEALHKADATAVSLEQSRKKERTLEEEGKRLAGELSDALRIVKELQEQKAAAAPPVQPVQFCPVGQSFSPQPSSSRHSKSSSTSAAKQNNAEIVEKNQVKISSSFDREPGEGIDSEQITDYVSSHSECLQRVGDTKSDAEVNRTKNVAKDGEICGKGGTSTFDRGDFSSSHSTAEVLTSSRSQCSEPAAEKLKLENAALRSELKDAREELQKRLDDLEVQRRAEAEARTRLKQLSRKHANQSVEKDEQDKEWREKLEREKAEVEKLRKTVAALQAEGLREKEPRQKKDGTAQEEERNKAFEDRESEMMELNMQLKKQLAEVKGQLALERDEREREANERRRQADADGDVAKELRTKLAALQAECEELRSSTRDVSPQDAKLSATNSPLMYLTLCDDELDSSWTPGEGSLLPSPEQHLLFCQAANQRNTLVSHAAAPLIQGDGTLIDPDVSGSLTSEHTQGPSDVQPERRDSPAGVARLLKENAREAERAKQYQLKFEALQSQVTLQTKQLTSAFDKQSRHISGLLAELREKESALHSQEEELQRSKQELDAFRARKAGDDQRREERTLKESNTESNIGLQEIPPSSPHTNTQELISDSEAASSDNQLSGIKGKVEADVTAELLSLRQENPLLQKKLLDFNASKTSTSLTPVDDGNQENQDQAKQNPSTSPAPPILDQWGEPADVAGVVTSCKEESEREERSTEERVEAGCQPQIIQLQQQVVELKKKLKALSAESQQQAEELAVWRLASQTAPIFDLQDETSILSQDHETTPSPGGPTSTAQPPPAAVQRGCGSVTVVREDELLLSCSSNKLQGHIVFSRLQQSNIAQPSKKNTKLQGHTWDVAKFDKDLEKENWDINCLSDGCEEQEEEEEAETDTDFVPPPFDPKNTKAAESPAGNPEVKLHVSEASNQITASSEQATGDMRPVMSSVGSQTEDGPCPPNAAAAAAAVQLVSAATQTEEEGDGGVEEELVESPPLSPVLPSPAGTEADARMLLAGSFPIPADPARLAERIRRNRTQLSAAFDDTEYEPYGLPEVVMKGFADIPSGPSCPYIVRRGLLGTVVSVSHKDLDQETD